MRRTGWIVLLGLGSIAGFAAGFHAIVHHEHGFGPRSHWHEHRVERFAEACVRAAERARSAPPAPSPPVEPAQPAAP